MEIETVDLQGVIIVKPRVFPDERGYFFESFRMDRYREAGIPVDTFVQENISCSQRGVLRGLHFQRNPFAQGKLVQVVRGRVLDVVVDLRADSPTYGRSFSKELSDENHTQLFVPAGYAHGFVALEDNTVFHYKTTAVYDTASEGGIRFDDPDLGIAWPDLGQLIVTEKDRLLPTFAEYRDRPSF